MQAADRSTSPIEDYAQTVTGPGEASLVRHPEVILQPLSRPELGEMRIDGTFAVGRFEQPFASCGKDILELLSRRHARIFRKDGFVYLVDLGSCNGTTVNRVAVGRAQCKLRDGDEICFGGALSYRVQIAPALCEANLKLILKPKSGESRLDPLVIAKWPFLIGKSDAPFSRYRSQSEHSQHWCQLSRRHAHIYLKDGQACIEDLGSVNGTYVDGRRLQGHGLLLQDGAEVALGGKHFVYEVSITRQSTPLQPATQSSAAEPAECSVRRFPARGELKASQASVAVTARAASESPQSAVRQLQVAREPRLTQASVRRSVEAASEPSQSEVCRPPAKREPRVAQADDKTQFVAAPTSFLELFCGADGPRDDGASSSRAAQGCAAQEAAVRQRPRNGARSLLSELASLTARGESQGARRAWWLGAAIAATFVALALTAYFWNDAERDLKSAVAHGEYVQAASLARGLLKKHPGDVELSARVTGTTLRANIPAWLMKVQSRDFDGADGVLRRMSELSTDDGDLRGLIEELGWLGNLERLVLGRGGPEAPIRVYADEDRVERLIGHWNEGTEEHQRALVRISSYVPQFADWYGEALTHLRKLQSGAAVYLPVIERVKANIASELALDDPDALQPMLEEAAAKYPALGGLDAVRQDLAHYVEIRREARAQKPGRLFELLRRARFQTPPFVNSLRAMIDSGRLPPADLLRQYDDATQAWRDGNSSESFAMLQKMTAGPWGEDAAEELDRRRAVAAQFAALQQSRGAAGFLDQLLAFRTSLDTDADVYFVRATTADLSLHKDTIIARALNDLNRARTLWEDYQSSGAIEASQRIETTISDQYRIRARLLAEASRSVQQGFLIYSQVDASGVAQWGAIHDEIASEASQQRSKLRELTNVLEPELLKTKLLMLGESAE